MFSSVSPGALVPADHPLRPIRVPVNRAPERLSGDFDELHAVRGRDSLLRRRSCCGALLPQVFYSVRSERRLTEQVTYNMLFRWFIGLWPLADLRSPMDAPVWDVTVFTENRDRLLRGEVAGKFFAAVLADPQVKPLLPAEHFSVDGTPIEAWASMKSFRPKDGSGAPPGPGRNGERDFHGEKRSNETHTSTTDPDARLAPKSNGQVSKLCYAGHVVMENRHGPAVATTLATGTAERDAGEAMMAGLDRAARSMLGAEPQATPEGRYKNYDTRDFVAAMRRLAVTPHVAQHTNGRRSAIDGRTTRHPGYAVSQRIRKRIEEVFGWGKEIGGMRRTLLRGLERVGWSFTLRVAAYNLIRLPKLLAAPA
ncbi:MAG: DDE transposase [Alphaproteobacteria bacterium]|nr:MAG: DDE transposase [Alphaproteobacteria bacterium]